MWRTGDEFFNADKKKIHGEIFMSKNSTGS
jgi:hypothetical protein